MSLRAEMRRANSEMKSEVMSSTWHMRVRKFAAARNAPFRGRRTTERFRGVRVNKGDSRCDRVLPPPLRKIAAAGM